MPLKKFPSKNIDEKVALCLFDAIIHCLVLVGRKIISKVEFVPLFQDFAIIKRNRKKLIINSSYIIYH